MNTRKLIAKIVYGFNAVLIIVLVAFLVYQQRLIRQMSDNERPVSSDAAVSVSNALAGNKTQVTPMAGWRVEQLMSDVETLRYQLEAAEEELEMARGDMADLKEDVEEDDQKTIAMIKRDLENPIFMEQQRRETGKMIVTNYGAFFESIDLPDEQLQALKKLMAEGRNEMKFLNLLLGFQSLPDEDRKKFQQQLEGHEAGFETQMLELLGVENYEEYNAYSEWFHERSEERSILHSDVGIAGGHTAISADLGLSEEKEQALIDAMYEARKNVESKYDGFDETDPWQQGSPNFGGRTDRLLEVNEAYIESARGILSESQVAKFEARINENKEAIKVNSSFLEGSDDESQ